MKRYFLFFLLLTHLACSQSKPSLDEVSRERNAPTPTQAQLDATNPIDFNLLDERITKREDQKTIRKYYLDNQLFTGWSLQLFPDTDHRYRYTKIENGWVEWQIGYYNNGDLDLDFRMKHGDGFGSQRMWRKNNEKYIERFYLERGIEHGFQYRWYRGNVPAEESLYDHGTLKYKIEWDTQGNGIVTEGDVPAKYLGK